MSNRKKPPVPELDSVEHLPDNYFPNSSLIPSEFKLDEDVRDDLENPLMSYYEEDVEDHLPVESKEDKQLENDFDAARQGIKKVLDQTGTVLTDAIVLARASDSPRAYEVIATMMKTISDINKDLLELHDKREGITKKKREKLAGGDSQVNNNNQQNNFFCSSPADLIEFLAQNKTQ